MIRPLDPLRSSILRRAGSLLSGSGNGAALLVLIYHRVLAASDPILPDEPDAAAFAAQMDLIRQNFRVLPLADAVRRLAHGELQSRSACITFDDGYANNCEIALPILAARNLPATVFVAPGFLSGGRMFNDTVVEALRRAPVDLDLSDLGFGRYLLTDSAARVKAISSILPVLKYLPQPERVLRAAAIADRVGIDLPADLMMTEEQVRRLHRSGIEIGAHTMNHPILARADDGTARDEIFSSKQRLQEITGSKVTSFAYPNGGPVRDYTRRDVTLVREAGFEVAVSTAWGAATASRDVLQIPRIAPWDRTALRFGMRMAQAYRERSAAVA